MWRYLPKMATGFNLGGLMPWAWPLLSAGQAEIQWAIFNLLLFHIPGRIDAELGKSGEIKGEMKTRPKRGGNEEKPFFILRHQT